MSSGGDDDLEELRRRRLQQVQAQNVVAAQENAMLGAQQDEMARRAAEQREVLRRILTPEARERLGRIRLAKPDAAAAVEQQLLSLAMSGRLSRQIDDATLRAILEKILPEKREIKITRR